MATCVVSGAAFLVLNGCGAQPDDGYSTPPPSSYGSAPQADLSGGPTPPTRRRAEDAGLAGGPATTASTKTYAGMAPIANPGDMPYDQCMMVYGPGKCRGGPRTAPAGYGEPPPAKVAYNGGRGTMAPIPNPEDMTPKQRRQVYPGRYAARASTAPARRRSYAAAPTYAPAPQYTPKPVAKPAPTYAPKPAATASYAPPAAPVAAPKPAQTYAPTPAVTPPAPPPAPMTATDKLSAAVKGDAIKGATLTVPDALSKGQPAKVTLTLPQDLLGIIQREAAKLGLTKQAKKAEVSATLSGAGYTIDPAGKQTKPLAAGQATSFDWQVKPGTGEKAPLRADVDASLTGKGKPLNVSLGSLEQAVASAVDDAKAKAKAKGFKLPHFSLNSLSWPGMPTLDVGGVKAKTSNVSAGLLALLALLVVWMLARGAGANRARAERRRKYRTMTDYGRNEMEAAPTSSDGHDDSHGYVNPMIAAAGGAALGAAAAHAADDHHSDGHHDAHGHDDHGHHEDHATPAPLAEAGHDDHGHDAHGHDHHGHDAHGHDDHGHHATHTSNDGHGHDDHGHDAHGHDGEHHDDGHGADAHAADGHAPDAHAADGHAADGHDDHGHGHDDHGHAPATLVSGGHDDHHGGDAHGHDAHGHHDDHGSDAHAADGHAADGHAADGHDEHGHDPHGDDHGHGHDDHAHKDHHEHEHA